LLGPRGRADRQRGQGGRDVNGFRDHDPGSCGISV
jgi:hypothetical protein